jgi:alpha-tubulin suppressor-like RCC1 family protein
LDLKNIIQIAVGDYHLLALDENGEVYGLGSNEFG